MPKKSISLDELGRGAVIEMFDEALEQVLDNIDNPNTEPSKKRKIVVEVSMKPDKTRSVVETDVSVKTTLAAPKPLETLLHVSRSADGSIIATENDPEQMEMFPEPERNLNVRSINTKE